MTDSERSTRRRSSRHRTQLPVPQVPPAPQAQSRRSRGGRRHKTKTVPAAIASFIKHNPIALTIVAFLLGALLAEMPWVARSIRDVLMRVLLAGIVAFLFLVGKATSVERRDFVQGATPWIAAIVVWCLGDTIFSPAGFTDAGAILRPFAVTELMRVIFCAAVYFGAAYCLPTSQIKAVVFGVLTVGTLVGLYGFAAYGNGANVFTGGEMTSIFGNHEQAASYLLMVLLAALTFAVRKTEGNAASMTASGMAVAIGGALLLARTRSAWLGAAFGLVVLVVYLVKYSTTRLTRANKYLIVGPALILLIAFAWLAESGELKPILDQRTETFYTLREDSSLADRIHRWKAACRMTYERPLTGWGLGSYPVLQERWTGQGDTPDKVIKHGTGHSNLAHNFWVQWASETGVVGLALYVSMVVAFLIFAGRLLSSAISESSRTILLIGFASVVAASVDMIGSPSYDFPGVSSLPFLWMGLATAATRLDRTKASDVVLAKTPAWGIIVPVSIAVLVVAVVLWVGSHQPGMHSW